MMKHASRMQDADKATYIDQTKYVYKAYGLKIASAVFFPEVIQDATRTTYVPDVCIRYGEVPRALSARTLYTSDCEIALNEALLDFVGSARYWVSQGKEIVVEPYSTCKEVDIRCDLLGPCMSFILHQRQSFVLHASAIEIPGGCVAFMAPSGWGKSTLAAAFYQRGFKLLTDDICAIQLDLNQRPYVHAAFPQLKLCEEAIHKLKMPLKSLEPLFAKEKYAVKTREYFQGQARPLLHIYQLDRTEESNIALETLHGIAKFYALKNHTMQAWALKALGIQAVHFNLCTMLHRQVSVSQLKRPRDGFQLEALIDRLCQHFETLRHTHSPGLNR